MRHEGKEGDYLKGLLCIALFVLGSAFLTAVTCSRFGAGYAVTDRYMPLSCYLWAVLAAWLLGGKTANRLLLAVLVACLFWIMPYHWNDLKMFRQFSQSAMPLLMKEPLIPDQLNGLYPERGLVEYSVPILRRRKMSIFRDY